MQGFTHEELRSEHDPRVILSPHRLVEALAYAYVAEHTARMFGRLRGGVGRVCAVVSLQQALARWLAGVLEVWVRARLMVYFYRWTRPLLIRYNRIYRCRCPSLAASPGPPSTTRCGWRSIAPSWPHCLRRPTPQRLLAPPSLPVQTQRRTRSLPLCRSISRRPRLRISTGL